MPFGRCKTTPQYAMRREYTASNRPSIARRAITVSLCLLRASRRRLRAHLQFVAARRIQTCCSLSAPPVLCKRRRPICSFHVFGDARHPRHLRSFRILPSDPACRVHLHRLPTHLQATGLTWRPAQGLRVRPIRTRQPPRCGWLTSMCRERKAKGAAIPSCQPACYRRDRRGISTCTTPARMCAVDATPIPMPLARQLARTVKSQRAAPQP